MNKKQKIWMWIFIAMFALPEILWGSFIKIFKLPFLPIYKNVQFFSDNPGVALFIIVIEIIGISGSIYLLNKKKPNVNSWVKLGLNVVLIIILIVLTLGLILSYGMSQVNFF